MQGLIDYGYWILLALAVCYAYTKLHRVNARVQHLAKWRRNHQVILITGAAHGIGLSLSLKLWEQLDHLLLILIDIDEKGMDDLVSTLPNAPHHDVRTYACDIGNESEVQTCFHNILQDIAPLSVTAIINNAGIVVGRQFQTLTSCQIRRVFDVNILSHFWILQCILPSLKMSKVAHIVTISSVLGLVPSAKLTDYCASKAALIAFHDSLRLELHSNDRIKMLLVCPIGVDTGMFAGAFQGNEFSKKLTRFVSPLLDVTQVAHRIFEAMIAEDQILISCAGGWRGFAYPWMLYLIRCLPVSFFDWIIGLAGGKHGMDTFIGPQATEKVKRSK